MHYDVLVIGNGAIGHAVAHAISRESTGIKIGLIGESTRPLAASAAAGAMLGAYSEVTATLLQSPAGVAKLKESLQAATLWPDWIAELNEFLPPADRLRIRQGSFVVQNSVGGMLDSENFDAIRKTLIEHEEKFEDINPQTIAGLKPWDMARPLRAMFLPNEGSIESDRLLAAYVSAADATGSVSIIDDRVLCVQTALSRVEGVSTVRNGNLTANRVVLANGVQAQGLLDQIPELRYRIPRLFSGGGSSLLLDPQWCYGGKQAEVVAHVVRTPNRSFACGLHMIPRGESHIYIGATNYISMVPWSRPNLSDMHFLIECAMEQLNQDFVWAQLVRWNTGNRPVTIDSCPLIGATSLDGLWIVSGTFRDGLHMSPLLAKQIAREVVCGERCTTPMFRPERPPISMTRTDAINEILKHHQAAWFEHRAVNSTKMGMHYELPTWLNAAASRFYEELEEGFVLPPEFFPLVDANPKNAAYFKQYFKDVANTWNH